MDAGSPLRIVLCPVLKRVPRRSSFYLWLLWPFWLISQWTDTQAAGSTPAISITIGWISPKYCKVRAVNRKPTGNQLFKILQPFFRKSFYWGKFNPSDHDLVSIDSSFCLSRSDLTSNENIQSTLNITLARRENCILFFSWTNGCTKGSSPYPLPVG